MTLSVLLVNRRFGEGSSRPGKMEAEVTAEGCGIGREMEASEAAARIPGGGRKIRHGKTDIFVSKCPQKVDCKAARHFIIKQSGGIQRWPEHSAVLTDGVSVSCAGACFGNDPRQRDAPGLVGRRSPDDKQKPERDRRRKACGKMNIKQVEEKSGLPRANIRYYEQQGLLNPARAGNNYRDYSGEDLAALSKIKLLRQLGLSVETIRRLQSGEEALPDVLAARMDELAAGAAAAGAARTVCAALRADGADYATLDAEKYLEVAARLAAQAQEEASVPVRSIPALEMRAEAGEKTFSAPSRAAEGPAAGVSAPNAAAQPQNGRPGAGGAEEKQPETVVFRTARPIEPAVPEGWQPADGHPWRRYLARQLDLLLYSLLLYFVAHGLLRCFPPERQPAEWFWNFLCPLLIMAAAEPLLLACCGTTPGKWLMGLRLVRRSGERFSYAEGWRRTWGVLAAGLGLNIPLVSQWRLYRSWRNESEALGNSWEEAGEQYLLRDERSWRIVASLAAQAVLIVCGAACILNGYLPAARSRAGVTPEQFAENFNSYSNYINGGYNATPRLQPDGSWQEGTSGAIVIGGAGDVAEPPEPPFVIETDDAGLVERIVYEWEASAGENYVVLPTTKMLCAMYSFAGAQPGASAFDMLAGGQAYETVLGGGFSDFTLDTNGVRVTYMVESRGYQMPGAGAFAFATLGEEAEGPACLRVRLCMEKRPAE